MKPYLEALTAHHDRLYIWLATEIEFVKLSDPRDSCRRWSSYRNQHWFSGNLATNEGRNDFISGALQQFTSQCVYDIEEQESWETGLVSFFF